MRKAVRSGLHLLIISAITAVFGVLTVFGVSAQVGDTFTVNTVEGAPIAYKVTSEGAFSEVEVSGCLKGYEGAVTLPENVVNPNDSLEYSVTSIGDSAFKDCNLTGITIPDSVKYIGWDAFCSCTGLTSATIPDSVTSIGDGAFYWCSALTSVVIPDSVTSIEGYTFRWCTNLTSVTIPESVTSIGNYAFANCSTLTSVIIPESITSIGEGAFSHCYNLSEVYCLSLKQSPYLERYAFSDCSSNIKIYIPYGTKDAYVDAGWPEDNLVDMFIKSVKVVDESGNPIEGAEVTIYLKEYTPVVLTKGYTNSEGIYTCPTDTSYYTVEVKKSGYKQVDTIVSDNFELVVVMEGGSEFICKTVEGAYITYKVTSDKTVAVIGCGKKYHGAVTLPESVTNPYNNSEYSVTTIEDGAFCYCESLTSITIPDSVTSIGKKAFYGCSSLSQLMSNTITPPQADPLAFVGCPSTIKIYIPAKAKDAYVAAGWPKNLLLGCSLTISGKVKFSDGTTHEGIEITLYDAYNNVIDTTITDNDGNYTLFTGHLDGGEYTIKATQYYTSKEQNLTILPFENKTGVDFIVSPIFIPIFPN